MTWYTTSIVTTCNLLSNVDNMLSHDECHTGNQSVLFKVFWNLYSLFEKKVCCEHMRANTWFSYNRGKNNLIHGQNVLLEMVLGVKVICVGMQLKVFQISDDAIKSAYDMKNIFCLFENLSKYGRMAFFFLKCLFSF